MKSRITFGSTSLAKSFLLALFIIFVVCISLLAILTAGNQDIRGRAANGPYPTPTPACDNCPLGNKIPCTLNGQVGTKTCVNSEECIDRVKAGNWGGCVLNPTPTPTPVCHLSYHECERLRQLAAEGPAKIIPELEYHGDDYTFEEGMDMNPATFAQQMAWFHSYDFHAVTGSELIGFINGTLQLPARSVVLSFDLTAAKMGTLARMTGVFGRTDMNGIFLIFSAHMDDSGWQALRDAYATGLVTIGSHSLTHRDFNTLSATVGLQELADSKKLLEQEIGSGCTVNILAWPFESVPTWAPQVATISYVVAFGGNTYPILDNAVHTGEPYWYKLPRVLPPNIGGLSGRPANKSLAQMMTMYTTPALDGVTFK